MQNTWRTVAPGKDTVKPSKGISVTLTHVDIALRRIYETFIPEK